MAGLVPAIPLRRAQHYGSRSPGLAAARRPGDDAEQSSASLHMIAVARQWIDHSDLFDREVGHDLDVLLVYDQHFLDTHAVTVFLAVLCLQSKCHAFLDIDGMIEGPDAGDHWRIVLGETEAVSPEVGGGLVLVLIAPSFHRRWPLHRDVAGGGTDFHRADRVVEPFQRGR